MYDKDELIPIIEVSIRHLGQQMVHAFADHIDSLKPLVKEAVDKALTSENIREIISKEVDEVVKTCITNSIGSYKIRQEIENIVTEGLLKNLNPNSENLKPECPR